MSVYSQDSDFWQQIQLQPSLQNKSPTQNQQQSLTLQQILSQLHQTLQDSYQKELMLILLQRSRQASTVEYKILLKKNQRKLHRQYAQKIHQISEQNLSMIQQIKNDYDKLKLLLNKKDSQIDSLRNLLKQSQSFITSQRIVKQSIKRQLPNKVKDSKQIQLKKEKKALNLQLEGMKSLVQMYQSQADQAKTDYASLQSKMIKREKEIQIQLESLNKRNQLEKSELRSKIESLENIFKRYKDDTGKQLSVSHIVNNRQLELLGTLQNQLRSAKLVLQTPRLRHKYKQANQSNQLPSRFRSMERQKNASFLSKISDRGSKVWQPGYPRNYSQDPLMESVISGV